MAKGLRYLNSHLFSPLNPKASTLETLRSRYGARGVGMDAASLQGPWTQSATLGQRSWAFGALYASGWRFKLAKWQFPYRDLMSG